MNKCNNCNRPLANKHHYYCLECYYASIMQDGTEEQKKGSVKKDAE